jgi:hypothetical protein
MKHLLACLAVIAAFTAGAQSMPYNPDANDDGYISSPDLLSFLPLFASQVGIDSSLTCDYDGTPIEEFFGNVWNGDIIIDSILVQYHTIDSAEVFIAGCPNPIWETVSYERAWMTSGMQNAIGTLQWPTYFLGYTRYFRLAFSADNGNFSFDLLDLEISTSNLDEVLGSQVAYALTGSTNGWTIPFPTDAASFDENGIHFEYWNGFLSGATYVNILPYWHYAE